MSADSNRYTAAWWCLFAAAFGVIEATVVVYIRKLLHLPYGAGYSRFIGSAGNGFGAPGINDALNGAGLLAVERWREAATILLLLAAACAERTGWRPRLARFCLTFAVWDLVYYIYLAIAAGYPHSVTDRDIYFLIPTAWLGPVWFPALIAMPGMIVISVWLERGDKPTNFSTQTNPSL